MSIIKDEVNAELIKYLALHPHKIYDLNPHKFEEVVAELIRNLGYDVILTPKTRDGTIYIHDQGKRQSQCRMDRYYIYFFKRCKEFAKRIQIPAFNKRQ